MISTQKAAALCGISPSWFRVVAKRHGIKAARREKAPILSGGLGGHAIHFYTEKDVEVIRKLFNKG